VPDVAALTIAPNANANPSHYRALHYAIRGMEKPLAQRAYGIPGFIWTHTPIYAKRSEVVHGPPRVTPCVPRCKHLRGVALPPAPCLACEQKRGGFEVSDRVDLLIDGQWVRGEESIYKVDMFEERGGSTTNGYYAAAALAISSQNKIAEQQQQQQGGARKKAQKRKSSRDLESDEEEDYQLESDDDANALGAEDGQERLTMSKNKKKRSSGRAAAFERMDALMALAAGKDPAAPMTTAKTDAQKDVKDDKSLASAAAAAAAAVSAVAADAKAADPLAAAAASTAPSLSVSLGPVAATDSSVAAAAAAATSAGASPSPSPVSLTSLHPSHPGYFGPPPVPPQPPFNGGTPMPPSNMMQGSYPHASMFMNPAAHAAAAQAHAQAHAAHAAAAANWPSNSRGFSPYDAQLQYYYMQMAAMNGHPGAPTAPAQAQQFAAMMAGFPGAPGSATQPLAAGASASAAASPTGTTAPSMNTFPSPPPLPAPSAIGTNGLEESKDSGAAASPPVKSPVPPVLPVA